MKKQTKDQKKLVNFIKKQKKSPIYREKSNSLIMNNRLTKSYFSLCDTSLSNKVQVRNQLKQAARSLSKPKISQTKNLQRYNNENQQLKKSLSFRDITHSSIPKINLRKQNKIQSERKTKSTTRQETQNLKFKLLFRDKPVLKSVSDKKINRIDKKIKHMQIHKRNLSKYIPVKEKPVFVERIKPKGTIVKAQKVQKLLHTLFHNIELYFSMYQEPGRVATMIRGVQGFNNEIRKILINPEGKANKIKNIKELQKHFWVFEEPSKRPQFYGQEDLNLFKVLQNYILKMQKSFSEIQKTYITFESQRLKNTKKSIAKQLKVYQKNYQPHAEIASINDFITNRKRHNQDRREENLAVLQSLGVRFNVQERSKQLVLRGKEKAMSNYNINKYMI